MKTLITGALNLTSEFREKLESRGLEITFQQQESDEVVHPEVYEAVICNGLFLHHDIEKFTNLKYIQLTSAGYDRVPMEYINEHKIEIYNARGVYSIPMAEFAIAGVLQLYKQSRFFYNNQQQKQWIKNREVMELYGKAVCIIGCGNVGQECAKRFQAFGCDVIGVDIVEIQSDLFSENYLLDDLDKVLSVSDIVVLTLPLTESTKHLMNRERLEVMKDEAVLVNIARGGVIDTEALIKVMKRGKFAGAVLDVFEEEPLSRENELWELENVVVTPHNSFVGAGNADRLEQVIQGNVEQ